MKKPEIINEWYQSNKNDNRPSFRKTIKLTENHLLVFNVVCQSVACTKIFGAIYKRRDDKKLISIVRLGWRWVDGELNEKNLDKLCVEILKGFTKEISALLGITEE